MGITSPLHHRPLGSTSVGLVLRGIQRSYAVTNGGSCIRMTGAGQPCLWTVDPGSIRNTRIENLFFQGDYASNDTLRGVFLNNTNYSKYEFSGCSFGNVGTCVDIDNRSCGSVGGNGEYVLLSECYLSPAVNASYPSLVPCAVKNNTLSGQAFCTRIVNCVGGGPLGSIFGQFGAGGGLEIYIQDLSWSFTDGTSQNVFLDFPSGFLGPVTCVGGRIEHCKTVIRKIGGGYNTPSVINIIGMVFTAMQGNLWPIFDNQPGNPYPNVPTVAMVNLIGNIFDCTGDTLTEFTFTSAGMNDYSQFNPSGNVFSATNVNAVQSLSAPQWTLGRDIVNRLTDTTGTTPGTKP